MKVLQQIKYTVKASHFRGYGIHSPFIFKVVSDLIYAKHPFYSFGELHQFYRKLSGKERKLALTLKNANRLYRLVNTLQPTEIASYHPDRLDAYLLSTLKAASPHTAHCKVLHYVGHHANPHWKAAANNTAPNDGAVWVVKHPDTLNKGVWNVLLEGGKISASLTFFGMGIAFTNSALPAKNFRIV